MEHTQQECLQLVLLVQQDINVSQNRLSQLYVEMDFILLLDKLIANFLKLTKN